MSTIKTEPKCYNCEKSESPMWRSTENGEICNECFDSNKADVGDSENLTNQNDDKKLRKSTRSTRFKSKVASVSNKVIPKGKSRRYIFKKTPFKSASITATTTTCDSLFYKGQYYQIGDIVSVMNKNDDIYYAQIRGLLTDTYCEKSAYITWLIPTQSSPPPNEQFDPSTYLIGPDEDLARTLSCMEFVMNAPSTYYHNKDNPFPAPDSYANRDKNSITSNFIWQNVQSEIVNK